MTSVSAGHITLTPTQPVESGRQQRGSNPRSPHQESRALTIGLPRPRPRPVWQCAIMCLSSVNPRLALVGLIIPPASVCVLMRWLFSCDHARRYNTLCGGHFELTLTAVALLLHSMENSIVLMGLRAVFSDWLHPIITTNQITVYLKHVGLF